MPNKLYIGTNTKMYKTIAQVVEYFSTLGELTQDIDRTNMELFVIPSFTSLETARQYAEKWNILLGAQNMCWEDEGQYTGEISPIMLREVGVRIVVIGHSERRNIFSETDEMENKKVLRALLHGFTALYCIGETEWQNEYRVSDEVIRTQLKVGLNGVSCKDIDRLWIAYEPTWAIGVNGHPASKEYANEKHALIHNTLYELFGEESKKVPVIYGGSVNIQNAEELISMPEIDGLFIGRSAWNAENFNTIIRKAMIAFSKKTLIANT